MAFNQNASAGQVVFSAQEPITKVVTANQDVTSSTTLVDVSDLTIRIGKYESCLLYTSPSPRDRQKSRMPSSA